MPLPGHPLPVPPPRGSGIATLSVSPIWILQREHLTNPGNVRPNRLFSASTSLVLYQATRSIITRIIDIPQAG